MLDEIATEHSDPGRERKAAPARSVRRSEALATRTIGLRFSAPPHTSFGDRRDRRLTELKHLLAHLPWADDTISEDAWKSYLVGFLRLRLGRTVEAFEAWQKAGPIVPRTALPPETLIWMLKGEFNGSFPEGTTVKHALWGDGPDRWRAVVACAGDGPQHAVGRAEFARYEEDAVMRLVYLDAALQWPLDRMTEAACRLACAVLLAADEYLDEALETIAPEAVRRLSPYGTWAWPLIRAWIDRARSGHS